MIENKEIDMQHGFPGVFQHAYFVENLAASAAQFAALLGAGPFFITRHHKTDAFMYQDTSLEADVSYAFGYAGAAQIQLIEQHDATPSIYLDMFPSGSFGLHHVAKLVEDYPAAKQALVDQGIALSCELYADGVWASYFDTRPQIHCYTELHSISERILKTFSRWQAAHQNWHPGAPIFIEPASGN